MRRILSDAEGFTISELLVAMLFGFIVMVSLYSFFRDQLFNLVAQETKTATLEDARGALDMMVRELRNAGSWGTGSQPADCSRIVQATATTIRVQMDTRGTSEGSAPDGDCGDPTEDVTYSYSSSSGNITRGGSTNPLVSSVVIPSGSDFLTYYDASGLVLAPPISDLSTVKRVKITFAVQVQNPNPNSRAASPSVTSALSSSVEFRN